MLIADGDPLARHALRDLLRGADELLVIAEAADGVEAAELALHYRPEVVLCELHLWRIDGLEAMQRVHQRADDVAFVFLTGAPTLVEQLACLRAGASGVLSKDIEPDALVRAISGVAAGEAAVSRELTVELVRQLRSMPRAGVGLRPIRSPLTAREWEVLDLLGAGHQPSAIAEGLRLAEDTVLSHLKHVARKLGVASRAELVLEADRLCRSGPAEDAVALVG